MKWFALCRLTGKPSPTISCINTVAWRRSCFQQHTHQLLSEPRWRHFPARNIIPSTRCGRDFMWDSSALYLLGFADQKHELYLLLFVYTSKCYSTVYANIFLNAGSCKTTTWVIFRLLGTAAVQKYWIEWRFWSRHLWFNHDLSLAKWRRSKSATEELFWKIQRFGSCALHGFPCRKVKEQCL